MHVTSIIKHPSILFACLAFIVLPAACSGGSSSADAVDAGEEDTAADPDPFDDAGDGMDSNDEEDAADDFEEEAELPPPERLRPSDFAYQGAFRLAEDFDWGARDLAFYPDGDGGEGSLFVIGFDARPVEFAQVSIPAPAIEPDWTALPMAGMLTAMASFDANLVEDALDESTTFGSGIEIVARRGGQESDKLYGSADWWYAVSDDTFPTIWFSELDGSNPRGMWHVGPESDPFHGNRMGDFLFTVPHWYADLYLGGRILVTGKTRGAFGGSMGPTLFAFHPWDSEDPSGGLDAAAMLWYRELYPDCAGPNVGDKENCDFPDFTMCDKWLGASFIESGPRRAVVMLGVKGLGSNGYGPPGEGDCNPYQGYHCDPFERQVIFYDVDELGEVALGDRDPWSVVPYAAWKPDELFLRDDEGLTCGETGGMAFDAAGGRVFMIEKGFGAGNSAVVHVWTIT